MTNTYMGYIYEGRCMICASQNTQPKYLSTTTNGTDECIYIRCNDCGHEYYTRVTGHI